MESIRITCCENVSFLFSRLFRLFYPVVVLYNQPKVPPFLSTVFVMPPPRNKRGFDRHSGVLTDFKIHMERLMADFRDGDTSSMP
jgi:hypothetical protein